MTRADDDVNRYEDAVLMPGQTVSAGVCLQSFVVATTDETFVPQFLDRFLDHPGREGQHTKVRSFV